MAMTLRLSEDETDALRKRALREGRSMQDVMRGALQDHVKLQTAPYKYPRRIDFAAELPKTASGKVRRALLREQG